MAGALLLSRGSSTSAASGGLPPPNPWELVSPRVRTTSPAGDLPAARRFNVVLAVGCSESAPVRRSCFAREAVTERDIAWA